MLSPSQYAAVGSFLIGLVYTKPLLAPASGASPGGLVARKFVQGSHIDDSHYQTVLTEYAAGQTIATKAKTLIDEDNYYYELFIPSNYQSEDHANEYNNNFLTKFIALGDDQDYTVTIDYIGTSNDPKCQQSSQPGYKPYAYTEDTTITMCDAFFAQPATSAMTCDNTYLDEYETGAMTLLHEFTHLSPAYFSLTTSPNPPFSDYAYGSAECVSLASNRNTASQAIINADNWMFVTLGAYWSDKCGKEIEPDDPDEGVYAGIDGQVAGCLPGSENQWILSTGGSCSPSGVASNSQTSGGPGGCGIPNTGGMNGVNVADCWVLPQGTTAVEMTLAVTNATQGFYTDYNMTAFTEPDCSGTAQSFWGPVESSDPLINGDYLFQTGCYDSPSGDAWQSYYVWNIAAYEKLYPGGGP
ncbi:MAG: hypothetical protein ALECFALPRED_010204 [Alectoria fallacina]|uniref:Lysine-specific metallo-endopeptidase domain-containing protein n=1 Tax=Alectoria fallacina TaxID=1903189 RepID=A0A8H3J8Z3_9LECA|nr:MAG: hypothetical protein ALECFALPRED_010204 [Alectoria fallacina]